LKIFYLFLSGLFLTGCFFSAHNKKSESGVPTGIQEMRGEVFGAYYIIKYVGQLDQVKFLNELNTFFKDFNDEFSTYQKSSVISQFNSAAASYKLKTSPRFIQMLHVAKRLSEQTKGAFDPTLGPVIKLWGFGGGDVKTAPSQKDLKEAMSKVGFNLIAWDEKTHEVWKLKDGVELDVNAFAPGWAADMMGELIENHNVTNYMIDISGELLIKGEKSPGSKWVVGIEKPSEQYGEAVQMAFRIKDSSVATSGDYRQFFDEKGERRSHIIDPLTGRPVTHKISSASVITNSAIDADAWSTALMVLGEKGIPLAEENGIKVFLLEATKPKEFKSILSPLMEEFLLDAQF
jgi:FAD:protein FMN transferase